MQQIDPEQNRCPICGSEMIETVIDYNDWNHGHLLVIRHVPIRECREQGHRYFNAKVARHLEDLFDRESQSQLHPIEFMKVPVVDFAIA